MDVTETPSPLRPEEAAACLPLSQEAGWNQVLADWQMMLVHGQGFAIRDGEAVPRASALALPMGEKIGWISMVLVASAIRRKGHAKRLMEACIDWLEARGLVPFLDATPLGAPLYRTMGFEPLYGLRRMAGMGGGNGSKGVRVLQANDLEMIAALDHNVFGGDRDFVLRDMLSRPGAIAFVHKAGDGFLLSRGGCNATQIGPLIAPDATAARELISAALAAIRGPVFIDVMADQPLGAMLEGRGFTEQRPFTRMARGLKDSLGDPARIFAAAGPELG